jgi:uncharacterized membrane protein
MVEDRITALEQHAATLEQRVRELESTRRGAPWDTTHPEVPAPPTSWPPPRTRPAAPSHGGPSGEPPQPVADGARTTARRPKRDFEDVLGGSVLAWLGGIAVLAGLAFLLTIAISRGWLGEGARTVLAGLFSAGLLGAGVYLREHKDRTEAALAAAAAGVAGLFGTLLIAGAVYELVPTTAALIGAFVVGAGATFLATRWDAALMGWLGLLGALWAPLALGAIDNAGALAFLAIAYAATIAVVLWQRWTALAWAAFATTTLQWLGWVAFESPTGTAIVVALVTFGTLTAALAFGLEARSRATAHAAALLVIDALLLAVAHGDEHAWLIALAAAHVVAGLAATRVPRISRPVALVTLGVGVGLADLVLVAMTDGLPVALGWAGPILAFAALLGARRRPAAMDKLALELRATFLGAPRDPAADTAHEGAPAASSSATASSAAARRHARTRLAAPPHPRVARIVDATLGRPSSADWYFAALGLVAQLVLAVGHVLAAEAPLDALAGPAAGSEALVAVGIIGVVAFLGARLSGVALLDVLALTALAHLTGLVFEGLPLTVALAAEGAVLALVSQRASLAFTALAAVHALATLAPPLALVDGLDEPLQAAVALAAVIAALATTHLGRRVVPVALLYLASVQVVTAGGAEHTGQTLLSVLWALTGVGALIVGLVRDERTTRLVALGLLALTAAKVFLYDLSELDSLARVASFIVFGLLLLLGAFAWQRVRPRALP